MAMVPAVAQITLTRSMQEALDKLVRAEVAIQQLYVDTVNAGKLTDEAIRSMLATLDPHSSYTTAEETRKMSEPLNGNFEGIGVQFNILDDTLVVNQTVPKGPSEKVGILAGDRIISVNDTTLAGVKMDRADIMKKLRGPKGTIANLKVVRRGVKEVLSFRVIRDKIPLHTVDAAYMIRPGVGFIRLSSFGMTSGTEVRDAIVKLKGEGMQSLILDLEENGGGYMQAAVNIASEFLQQNDMIVYTDGRSVPHQEMRSTGGGQFLDGKLIVLVNDYSASAAEIVAGAIQDQDRGLVVGRRSFGKGLVQRPIPFADGSMMRLTIAHYYTPSGRCIQKPYKKGDLKDYEMELDDRYKHGELYSADSIHFADSLKFYTLRKHRTVYGGGGIMPDYFVPLDTTLFTRLHRQLMAKGIVIKHNLKYVDDNRKELKSRYKLFSDFQQHYTVPQALVDSILADGKKQKIEPKDEKELQQTLPYLKTQLKALVARDIWDMNEYFQIINEKNKIISKALQIISKEQ